MRVCYWRKPNVVVEEGDAVSLPRDMVLWIEVSREGYRHRLKGGDVYWVDGDMFGMIHHHSYRRGFWLRRRFEHVKWRLSGEPFDSFAWRWKPEGGSERIDVEPSINAVMFTGGLAPNRVARDEGLL